MIRAGLLEAERSEIASEILRQVRRRKVAAELEGAL
jgi:hypothetical protein